MCYGVLLWWWVGGQESGSCNLQSDAPDDGQMFVRNMLNWSWKSRNIVICCIYLFLILLHCLHGRCTVKHKSKRIYITPLFDCLKFYINVLYVWTVQFSRKGYIAHSRQQCHNSKFVIFQEKLLKVITSIHYNERRQELIYEGSSKKVYESHHSTHRECSSGGCSLSM
jgi:hypothetical protein